MSVSSTVPRSSLSSPAERAKETNCRVRPSAFSSPGGNSSSSVNSVTNSSSRRRSRSPIARSRPCASPRRGAGMGRMSAPYRRAAHAVQPSGGGGAAGPLPWTGRAYCRRGGGRAQKPPDFRLGLQAARASSGTASPHASASASDAESRSSSDPSGHRSSAQTRPTAASTSKWNSRSESKSSQPAPTRRRSAAAPQAAGRPADRRLSSGSGASGGIPFRRSEHAALTSSGRAARSPMGCVPQAPS